MHRRILCENIHACVKEMWRMGGGGGGMGVIDSKYKQQEQVKYPVTGYCRS